MQVKKLNEYITQYKDFLKRDRLFEQEYKWKALSNFQEHWEVDAPDFASMYDRCLQSDVNRRLWKRESWFPKVMMQKFIALDAEFVRRMFKDLFDENIMVEVRISRFKFCCDTLLSDYKRKHKNSIENAHYHDDSEAILFYLAMRYPEQYALFDYPSFRKTTELLGVKNIPSPFDLERFFKLTKIMNTFLKKDEELMNLCEKRLDEGRYYQGGSRLVVGEFCWFCAETFKR